MNKRSKLTSTELVTIITAIIGFIGTITVAYFAFRGNTASMELSISTTQTAESKQAIPTSIINANTEASNTTEATLSPVSSINFLFEDGCIDKSTWSLVQGNSAPENNNCWNLEKKGIIALKDIGLSINVIKPQAAILDGIVTNISLETDISFDLQISDLSTISGWNTNIAIGLLPYSTALPSQDGVSILFQAEEPNKPVWMMLELPNLEQIYLPPPRIVIGKVYNVKLQIRGLRLITYLDNEIVDDRGLSNNNPFLWIGYSVAEGGTLFATISNFSIEIR